MGSLPQDLLPIILAKLPLKSIAISKLVCKQWKSILESKSFYQLFQSHHQNSHSLWSLMCRGSQKEVIAHYGCTYWGLTRSLGSYISSFITSLVHIEGLNQEEFVWVAACSDVGLILIASATRASWHRTFYVANPISREYVKIPPLAPCTNWGTAFETSGLVTQVENGVVLSYKIVLTKHQHTNEPDDAKCLLIYSSETGLWSFNTIRAPISFCFGHPISLNGNLYWISFSKTLQTYVFVYYNLYSTGPESDRCRVIPFPGVEVNVFRRVCATSQGSLMYMKLVYEDKDDGSVERKLSVWRLKSEEWLLVSEISLDFMIPGFNFWFTINPSDVKTAYYWSHEQNLTIINLDKCKTELPNNFECSSRGCSQRISEDRDFWRDIRRDNSRLRMFVLPRWLYRIPCPPSQSETGLLAFQEEQVADDGV